VVVVAASAASVAAAAGADASLRDRQNVKESLSQHRRRI
jgi:hypothetical protein